MYTLVSKRSAEVLLDVNIKDGLELTVLPVGHQTEQQYLCKVKQTN